MEVGVDGGGSFKGVPPRFSASRSPVGRSTANLLIKEE